MAYATLVSIDAWRNSCGGWDWNDQHKLREYTAEEIAKVLDAPSGGAREYARRVFTFLRAEGYLSAKSAGKVRLDVAGSEPEYITIAHRHTGEPIFAFIVDYSDDASAETPLVNEAPPLDHYSKQG